MSRYRKTFQFSTPSETVGQSTTHYDLRDFSVSPRLGGSISCHSQANFNLTGDVGFISGSMETFDIRKGERKGGREERKEGSKDDVTH